MKVFHSRITTVAGEIAVLIRSSPVNYAFMPKFRPKKRTNPLVLCEENLGASKMIDVQTERPLRKSTNYFVGAHGRVGDLLCWIYPSLKRCGWRDEYITISKSKILVKLDDPPASLVSQGTGIIQRWMGG